MTNNSLNPKLNYEFLVLTLIYRCNYRCRHCMLGDRLDDHTSVIEYDKAIQIIESAAQARTFKCVSFVGGEPFLVYKLMLDIADYTWRHYGCYLSISTNSYWARSYDIALSRLQPLYERGLRTLLVSLDDFHAEFSKGGIGNMINCINAANELGIVCTVQNIIVNSSNKEKDYRAIIGEQCDLSKVVWVDNACVPVGLGAEQVLPDDLPYLDEVPIGGCSAGEIMNVQPTGEVKPCCGAGMYADRLTMGNAFQESISNILDRMETDPIINSLITWKGPHYLVQLLRDRGYSDLVKRLGKNGKFVDVCHACHAIVSDPECLQALNSILARETIPIIAARILSQNNFVPQG